MTSATRLPGWEQRLLAELEQARLRPFEWGAHDCVHFAARCVQACTGAQVQLPGRWRSPRGAARAVRRSGGWEQALSQRLGERVQPSQAQRGDVGLVPAAHGPTGFAVAVCAGAWFVAPGLAGLQRFGPGDVLHCWSVG